MPNDNLNNNQYITQEDILKAYYDQDPEHFLVFANVLVPPFHTFWHQISKDGWTVIPTSGGTKYYKEFEINSAPKDWLDSIDSLGRLLLAYFMNDYAPRKIHSFELPQNLEKDKQIQLITVFGNPQTKPLQAEENAKLSFYMSGTMFTGMSDDPHFKIDNSLIIEWYDLFNNKTLYTSVNLLEESFILINKQLNKLSFYNYIDLSMGIILLVSALENLFTHDQETLSDIRFKFSLIGSLYYQKNVSVEFLKGFNTNFYEKFTQGQFREILSALYDLRSDIAHGSYKKVLNEKGWKKLFDILKIYYVDSLNKADLSRQIALALGLLQKHIIALIIQSKTDLLSKGTNIVDEVTI
jgi:hypothetical protein